MTAEFSPNSRSLGCACARSVPSLLCEGEGVRVSGESSPAFPGLMRVRVFWPFMKRLNSSLDSSPTARVRNWERKDSHLIKSSIKPEKTQIWTRFLICFPKKTKLLEKQVSKRLESLAKDSNIFFLPRKSPKDSNPRTRVRRLDSPLVRVDYWHRQEQEQEQEQRQKQQSSSRNRIEQRREAS
jgi:hypothetical protein